MVRYHLHTCAIGLLDIDGTYFPMDDMAQSCRAASDMTTVLTQHATWWPWECTGSLSIAWTSCLVVTRPIHGPCQLHGVTASQQSERAMHAEQLEAFVDEVVREPVVITANSVGGFPSLIFAHNVRFCGTLRDQLHVV